jgi:peptidoglycan/LPS O-acetylase OafA/YrhL
MPSTSEAGRHQALAHRGDRTTKVWSPTTPLRYMPQLDGLRAFAAGLVVLYHFWRPAREYLHLGGIGVRVFFVLSGFLITGILLRSRAPADGGETSAGFALRRFYLRRVLRIFPLYYFALAIAYYARVSGAREGIGWHVAYLSNVRFFLDNAAHPGVWGGYVGHFWSLAVEEQFYLVWPWVVLFAPRRWLPGIALAAGVSGPIFRYLVFTITGNDITPILLPGCIDSLALGAYLAMTVAPEFAGHPLIRPIGVAPLWAGLLLLAAHQAAAWANGFWTFRLVSFDLAVALASVWLVARAAEGIPGPAGRLLGCPPIRYLGTISYGIYVYHRILPDLLPRMARRFGHADLFAPLGDQTLAYLAFYSVVTIAVAAVSWHLFEGPINRFKNQFEYRA